MKYFNSPPQAVIGRATGNIPRFIKKYYTAKQYDLEYVLNLFRWSEIEYNDTKAWAQTARNIKVYNWLKDQSPFCVLALSSEFKDLVTHMTSELWNSLPKTVQNSLIITHNIYKGV